MGILPTSGGRSVGTVCLQNQETEFSFCFMYMKEDNKFVESVL
jgi:hypothetical protein